MGMSCFLVQNCTHFSKVSCFSVHFCSQLSQISCFVCMLCIFGTSGCDSVLMCCSLWQAVPESSWSFNAILRCFLIAVYGNVVFSRSKMDAHHTSLVFFRSLLLTAVANLMFCMYCLHMLQIFVWFCVVRCSLWHAVPESSWSFNAILCCFLRAVYGNVVFSRCLLTGV